MTRLLPALTLLTCLTGSAALAETSLVQVYADAAYTALEFRADGQAYSLNSCTIMLSKPVRELKTMPDLQQVTGFVHLPLRDMPIPPLARQAMGKIPEIIFEIERMEPVGAEPKAAAKPLPKGKKPVEAAKTGLLGSGKVFDVKLVGSVHVGNIRYAVPPVQATIAASELGLAVQSRSPVPLKWPAWPTAESATFTLFLTRD